MQKLGVGFTNYSNTRYKEVGRVFQGSYKARRVDTDMYIKYLSAYIQVVNPFELYPEGFKAATREFDKALDFATNYPFCSLADYLGQRKSLILDKDILGEVFSDPKSYREFVSDVIAAKDLDNILGPSLKID